MVGGVFHIIYVLYEFILRSLCSDRSKYPCGGQDEKGAVTLALSGRFFSTKRLPCRDVSCLIAAAVPSITLVGLNSVGGGGVSVAQVYNY